MMTNLAVMSAVALATMARAWDVPVPVVYHAELSNVVAAAAQQAAISNYNMAALLLRRVLESDDAGLAAELAAPAPGEEFPLSLALHMLRLDYRYKAGDYATEEFAADARTNIAHYAALGAGRRWSGVMVLYSFLHKYSQAVLDRDSTFRINMERR